jgi:TolB protein
MSGYAKSVVLGLALIASLIAISPHSGVAGELPPRQDKIVDSCGFDFVLDICIMNSDGSDEMQLTDDGANDHSPELSPNGSMIAWMKFDTELWVMGADGSNQHMLRNFGSFVFDPTWSPDASQVAFACTVQAQQGICTANSDGSSDQDLVIASQGARQPDWSADGSKIVFEARGAGDNTDIFVANLAGGQPTNLTNTPAESEHSPRWSPDDTKIAFWGLTGAAVNGWFKMDANGTNRDLLFQPMFFAHPSSPAWSPDGTLVALICDHTVSPMREMCVVNAETGALDHSIEVASTHDSEGWTEPSWATGGGVQGGDIDCSGAADPIDSLKLLRYDAGLSVTHAGPCLEVGEETTIGELTLDWGDIDCDGVIGPVDALKVLRFDAGLSVQQQPGCPPLGEFLD